MYIYINGQIEKQEDARISPLDHGYLYGVGLFETLRIYDGHPFLLDDHLRRLLNGLEELKIKHDLTREKVLAILTSLLNKNRLENAYVRINVSAGNDEVGLKVGDYLSPTVIVFMKPIPFFAEEKEGIVLKTVRNTPEGQTRLKSHHFLNNIYAKREIGDNPNAEGVFLTKEGFVAEGITSNLFFVKDNKLFTPSINTGILNGITRQFIMKIANQVGLSVHDGFYPLQDLLVSSEVFITNSIQEIVPLYKINSNYFPGKEGKQTLELQVLYRQQRKMLSSINDI
jgi:4-amino-4-deoxychorismate lyase